MVVGTSCQPMSQCNPAPGTQVGVELAGTVNLTLSESNAEICCYYANRYGGKGWTFEIEGGDTCDKQTIWKGIALEGSSSGVHVVSTNSSSDCCSFALASGRSAWTYDETAKSCSLYYAVRGRRHESTSVSGIGSIPGLEQCSQQTRLEGIAFDWSSAIHAVKTNTSDECCNVAEQQMRSMWSFNKKSLDCTVFYELRGRHVDHDVVSAMGATPNVGTCKIFSDVTGKKANPRAMSVDNDKSATVLINL
jgi:hypothetical protein